MKNECRIKKLSCARENTDAFCKSYVDSGLNNSSIVRNNAHVDFHDKNLDNVRFVEQNGLPVVRKHLTAE